MTRMAATLSLSHTGGEPKTGYAMVGKTKDPKGTRITVRISDKDLSDLQAEARRKNITVGAVVRFLIRERLSVRA